MLGLKLNHVSKRGHMCVQNHITQYIHLITVIIIITTHQNDKKDFEPEDYIATERIPPSHPL